MPFNLDFSSFTPIFFVNALILVVGFIYSIILHEIAHGLTAYWFGDPTARDAGRLTLDPIPHIDPIGSIALPLVLKLLNFPMFGWAKPVPVNPLNFTRPRLGNIVVSLAGVVTNFLLMAVFFIIIALFRPDAVTVYRCLTEPGMINVTAFYGLFQVAFINIMLMSFNLMPLPPLDGYHFLMEVLPEKISRSIRSQQTILTIILMVVMVTPLFSILYRPIFGFFVSLFMGIFQIGR